jgi:hypothetical protein
MSWDSVPWFVGGGAQHSPEVARLLAYAATSGAEGIVNVADLKVQPLAVPGGSVRVLPGAALIRNRAAGGDSQTYVARNPVEDVVAVAPTGSGLGRSDLIVAQIEDPYMAGEPWQDPADPTVGPYVFTRVIPNVPAGTTRLQDVPGYSGRSAVALARIDIPASTGTITSAMIKDVRRVANPRTRRQMVTIYPTGKIGDGTAQTMPTAGYSSWPITADQRPTLDVPEWATKLDVVAHYSGVHFTMSGTADTVAGIRTGLGSNAADNGILIADTTGRGHYTLVGSHAISAAQRGTSQTLNLQAVRSAGAGIWRADYQTSIVIDWQFTEAPV